MNIKLTLSILALGACGVSLGATPEGFYPATSALSGGKWVKVEVSKSGVYEISYDELRMMGFSDPSKVGVFGQGGRQMSDQFTNAAGEPVVPADIDPISVYHTPNSLIFYGEGLETIVPVSNNGTMFGHKFRYNYESRNCYSNSGYYLLSDTSCSEMTAPEVVAQADAQKLEYGVDYWYHEQDLTMNPTNTGRLIFGEDIRPSLGESFAFNYNLPLAVLDRNVRFNGVTCSHFDYSAKIGYQLSGNDRKTTTAGNQEGVLTAHSYNTEALVLREKEGSITITPITEASCNDYFNLDYLLMSYTKSMFSEPQSEQQRYMFPQMAAGTVGTFTVAYAEGQRVIDISDRRHPRLIPAASVEEGVATYNITAMSYPVEIMIFNEGENLAVGATSEVENSDLHAKASLGGDLIIITTKEMMPHAERLARLHAEHDGIRTIIADVDELYNEFSGGVPDAMAYRNFARMVYKQGAVTPKNLLLFGPLYADCRGLLAPREQGKFIIAYQDPTYNISLSHGSYNSNEWLGNFDDFNTSQGHLKTYSIGVGILPCTGDKDASLIVDKIEQYMLDESFAYRSNHYVAAGGVGDNQMHALFTIAVAGHYGRRTGNATIVHPVIADAYPNAKKAAERMTETLTNEPLMACFFGHGNPYAFGSIYETNNIGHMKNKNLSFMIFAGCTLGKSDMGAKGIGEHMIFSTRHGLVGGLVPSRASSAYANRDLVCALNEAIYCTNPCCPSDVPLIRRDEPQTIGEAVALAKSSCTSSTVEGAYQLVCDPALRIPFPTLDVNVDAASINAKPGEKITVTGRIETAAGSSRDEFNGEVVLRLMAPEYVQKTINKISRETTYTDVTYNDRTLQMAAARVKDGKFIAEIVVPSSIADHDKQTTKLYLAAFDPESRLSAAGWKEVSLDLADTSESAVNPDVTAPVVERFAYNHATNEIEIVVSDDTALDISEGSMSKGLALNIDRINQPQVSNGSKVIDPDSPRYSKIVSLGALSETMHVAELTVHDAAGNCTTAQLVFTPGDVLRPVLAANRSAVAKSVALNMEPVDASASEDYNILVIDSAGEQAARFPVKGNEYTWDGTDENGERLSPGIYTLTAVDAAGRHSAPLHLSIL